MRIAVLNGSPKGKNSITLQTVLYLQKMFPDHEFTVFHVGQRIRSYEKDMSEVVNGITQADLVLFSYPVYTFLVPSQLHRFMELLKENGADLSGKYMTQISTSKHFYDVTAHRFLEENCRDLGMKVLTGLSADMSDLTLKKGQEEAAAFFRYTLFCMECERKDLRSIPGETDDAAKSVKKRGGQVSSSEKTAGFGKNSAKPVVIVADLGEEDASLISMIRQFRAQLPYPTKVVNIRKLPFQGGCLSCFHCAGDGTCIYKDRFDEFLRKGIQNSAAIVYAFRIKDHSMGARFKLYDDRQFCNGHRTVTMGNPTGYLVSGAYSQEANLQMVLEARAQVGGNYLTYVACDEKDPEKEVEQLSVRLSWAIREHYTQPQNFYGVGGMKIFRDLIYQMQGLMREDHKFFKTHGQYDFPQKEKGTILAMYLVGEMMRNPKIQKKLGGKMTEGMLMPYKKVLDHCTEN